MTETAQTFAARLVALHLKRLEVGARSDEGQRLTREIGTLLRENLTRPVPFDVKRAQAGEREDTP